MNKNHSSNFNHSEENENNNKTITFKDIKTSTTTVDDSAVYPKHTSLQAALKTKKSCPNFSYNKEISDISLNDGHNNHDNDILKTTKKSIDDTHFNSSYNHPSTTNNSTSSSSNNISIYKLDTEETEKGHEDNNEYHHTELGTYLPKKNSETDISTLCNKACNTPVSEATLIDNQNHVTPLYNSQKFYINSTSSSPDKTGISQKNFSPLSKIKNRNNSNQSGSTFVNPPNSSSSGNNNFDAFSNQSSSNNSPKTVINDGSLYNSSNNTSSGQLNNINLCFSSSSLSSDFVVNNPSLMSYSPSSVNSQIQTLSNTSTTNTPSTLKSNHNNGTPNLATSSSSTMNSNPTTSSSNNNNILTNLNLNLNSSGNNNNNDNSSSSIATMPVNTKVKSYTLNKSEIEKNSDNSNHILRSKNTTSTPDITEKALGQKKNVRNCKSYADFSLSIGNRRKSLTYLTNIDDSITESSFIDSSSEDSSLLLTEALRPTNQYHSVINPQQTFEATYDAYKNSKNKSNNGSNRKTFVNTGNKGFKIHSLISSSNHDITNTTPNNSNNSNSNEFYSTLSHGAYADNNNTSNNNTSYDKSKNSQQQQKALKVKKRISSLDIKKYYLESMNGSGTNTSNNAGVTGPSSLPQNYSSFNFTNGSNNNSSIDGKSKRNSLEKSKTNNRKSYHQDIQENIDLMKQEQSFLSDFSESILNEIKDSNTINNLYSNFNDFNLSSSKNKSILSNSSSDTNISKEINSIIPDYFNSNGPSSTTPLKSSSNSMKSHNSVNSLLNNGISNASSVNSNNSNNNILNMNSSIMHNGSLNGSVLRNNSNNTSILRNNSNKSNSFNLSNNTLLNGQLSKKNSFIKSNRNSIYSDENKSLEDLQYNYKRLSSSKKNVDDLNKRSSKLYEYDKEITLINDEEEKENIFNKRQPSNCSNKTHW
ncbi:hypothetical protein PIROE2DRAFT_56814 [Piromyces sp. E2]|nr:hypothetical protein PIROE2DRAFT_56814 [Piromyces sp. E2]|eukprot:OUM70526.1 hypothetical protein PIROE2DRAFT_56814 [Piromyces sp. E2]